MKQLFLVFGSLFLIQSALAKGPQFKTDVVGQLLKVEAAPERGFNFPFFLYLPKIESKEQRLLVIPNNSGSSLEDFDSQLQDAKRQALNWGNFADRISAVLLVPGFPRPNVDPPVYTHSLSRSTLLVKDGNLKRLDLQLIKMTEAARVILAQRGDKAVKKKIILFGFSASAMFVNRFSFMHPNLVAAVAFGAPGGWPIAPLKEFKSKTLRYPIGIADLDELSGKPLDIDSLRKVPILAFLGSKDENDSVVFRDGYTEEDQQLVFSIFGKTPVERWPAAEKLYKETSLNATFKLYEGLGHETNKAVLDDVVRFFNTVHTE